MAVDLIDATTTIRSKQCSNKHFPGSPIALYSEARYLIIRLPNSKFIKICFRFLLLILALASFQFMIRSSSSSLFNEIISPTSTHHQQKSVSESIDDSNSYSMDTEHVLSILFRDLTNEGLVKKTQQKAVFLCNEDEKPSNVAVNDYNMEHVPLNDLEKQNSVLDNSVDFIYTSNYPAASKFIERVLKTEGIATVLINNNPSVSAPFYKPSNCKIAYMRRFDSIAVAMKKNGGAIEPKLAAPRKLCSYASEAKKAALQKLEDVLLEPPRAASGKSRKYLKRTRYLPDLMGDSLESYPVRIAMTKQLPIDEEENSKGVRGES